MYVQVHARENYATVEIHPQKDTEYCNSSLPKEQASLRLDVIWDTLSRNDPPQRRARRGKGNEYGKKM